MPSQLDDGPVGRTRIERASAAYKAAALSIELPAAGGPPGTSCTFIARLSTECLAVRRQEVGWPDGLEPTYTRFTVWPLDHFGIDQHKNVVPQTGVEPMPPGFQSGALPN